MTSTTYDQDFPPLQSTTTKGTSCSATEPATLHQRPQPAPPPPPQPHSVRSFPSGLPPSSFAAQHLQQQQPPVRQFPSSAPYPASMPPPPHLYAYYRQQQPIHTAPPAVSAAPSPFAYYPQYPLSFCPPSTLEQQNGARLAAVIFAASCGALEEKCSETKRITDTQFEVFQHTANLAIAISKRRPGVAGLVHYPLVLKLSIELSRGLEIKEVLEKSCFLASVNTNAHTLLSPPGSLDADYVLNAISTVVLWFGEVYRSREADKATVPKILEFISSL